MRFGSGRPAWRDEGTEPDPRFSLANERTYLAWVRTALALFAAAVAVVRFVPGDRYPALRTILAVLLAGLGLGVVAAMYLRWRAIEQAVRHGRPLPHSPLPLVMAVVIGVAGVLVLVLVGWR